MNLYSDESRHGFEHTLSCLTSGLGTRIPWDEECLVESLSDSTIYMAYYRIAHFLHNGDMYGNGTGRSPVVGPEQMTDEVWDYVFCDGPYPESSGITSSTLKNMKEFEYCYPFDLRVSGKDLIQNHLTFSIYNHVAIMSKKHWPHGFRLNGHMMLNAKKMSKSTGDFKTLCQAIEEFSADATQFSLANAGDGLDDANFVSETATAAILKLTNEIKWMKTVIMDLEDDSSLRLRRGPPSTYADHVFANEINIAVKLTEQHYRDYMFREALKTGFYHLQAARDEYRLSCRASSGGIMNCDLVWHFIDVQTRLISPICPHYAEYVWRKLMNKEGFVVKAGWPVADTPDLTLKSANKYVQDSIVQMRKQLKKESDKKPKNKYKPEGLMIYVNEQYDGWRAECLRMLQSRFDINTRSFALDVDGEILEAIKNSSVCPDVNFKKTQKICIPFLKSKKYEAVALGVQALDLRLPFGEMEVLCDNSDLIKTQMGLEEVQVLSVTDPNDLAKAGPLVRQIEQNPPTPGNPTAIFYFL